MPGATPLAVLNAARPACRRGTLARRGAEPLHGRPVAPCAGSSRLLPPAFRKRLRRRRRRYNINDDEDGLDEESVKRPERSDGKLVLQEGKAVAQQKDQESYEPMDRASASVEARRNHRRAGLCRTRGVAASRRRSRKAAVPAAAAAAVAAAAAAAAMGCGDGHGGDASVRHAAREGAHVPVRSGHLGCV